MLAVKPFFSYFGSKYRLARKYPAPKHPIVVEPFAGSACYSTYYNVQRAVLYDTNPVVCGVWDFLINATAAEVMRLPLDFDSLEDVKAPQEAKWLIGFWLGKGRTTPCVSHTAWAKQYRNDYDCKVWGPKVKERLLAQMPCIREWKCRIASYQEADFDCDVATWFIDPPYTQAGKHYPHSDVDYSDLSMFCTSRLGQTIVCEDDSACWLPFKPLAEVRGVKKRSVESVWIRQ